MRTNTVKQNNAKRRMTERRLIKVNAKYKISRCWPNWRYTHTYVHIYVVYLCSWQQAEYNSNKAKQNKNTDHKMRV